MKKNLKENNKQKVIGKQLKEFVPSTYTHLREFNAIQAVITSHCDRNYETSKLPREIPKEWNKTDNKEIINKSSINGDVDANDNSKVVLTNVYSDLQSMDIILPHSLYHNYLNDEIKWSRPEEYIREDLLDKEIISNYPNKTLLKFKIQIKEMYAEKKAIKSIPPENKRIYQDFINNGNNYYLYNDLFKIIEQKPDMKIVNYYTRDETDEEYDQRIKKEREEEEFIQQQFAIKMKKDLKIIKKKKGDDAIIPIVIEKKQKNILAPSNISMKNAYPAYCRWLASIFQVIKDRNIVDVNNGETIWQKIYPQEDNVPIYNPQGHYIVKLYYMGKLRQIEIDDTMPCSRYDEFYLPRCDLLNELWPAILTKAIMKLYSYTFVSSSYNECGDYGPFYSLIGLIPQILSYDSIKINTINDSKKVINCKSNDDDDVLKNNIEFIKEALTDENYINKKQFILCYRKEHNSNNTIENNPITTTDQDINNNENDLIPQKRYIKKDIQPLLLSAKKNNSLVKFKRKSTIAMKSTSALLELKRLKDFNQLPSSIKEVDNNDDKSPSKIKLKKKKTSNYLKKHIRIGSGKSAKSNNADNTDNNGQNKENNKYNHNDNEEKKSTVSLYQSHPNKKGIEKFENKIYVGVLYDIIDYFDNKEFNMNKLKPIDFSDLKEMIKQLNSTYVFKQLPKDKKKIYIEKLKEIKIKQKNEKERRIEELQSKGASYQSIKISNSSVEEPQLYIAYTHEEIEMTKKCLINNWAFPPIEYIDKVFDEKFFFKYDLKPLVPLININNFNNNEEAVISGGSPRNIKGIITSINGKGNSPKKTVRFGSSAPIITEVNSNDNIKPNDNNKKKKNSFGDAIKSIKTSSNTEGNITNDLNSKNKNSNDETPIKKPKWNREVYFQLINNNTEQYQNAKEPIKREKGTWVEQKEFFKCFNSFLLLNNPNMYRTCFDWDNNLYDITDHITMNKAKRVLHLSLTPEVIQSNPISPYIIMMFCANSDKFNCYRNVPYIMNFSLIEKNKESNKKSQSKRIALKSFMDTKQIKLDISKEYYLIIEGGIFPSGFFFRLLTDFNANNFDYSAYLCQHMKYNKMTYKVEHSIIGKSQPYMLLRLLVNINETNEIVIISNQNDCYAKEFTQCYLINNKTMTKRKIALDEVIKIEYNNDNNEGNIENKMNIDIKGNEYLIVITTEPPFNLPEALYEIEILYDKQSTVITIIENIPQYEISDFYIPNKHNYLFQEFVFAGDKVYSMFFIKLRKLIKENTEQQELSHKTTISTNNNIKDKITTHYKEEELDERIRMTLQIYDKDGTLLNSYDFYNEITIHNATFEGNVLIESKKDKNNKGNNNKDETTTSPTNVPYLIKCFLDKDQLPQCFINNDSKHNLNWLIRVFSSDTLGFCKDTTKEDMEKNMIHEWETREPGRANKGKLSRRRFILEKKLLGGQLLDDDDTLFISTPRPKKIFLPIISSIEPINNSKSNIKNDKLSRKNMIQKETKINLIKTIQHDDLNKNKPHPQLDTHVALYARNYLQYVYNERIIKYDHNYTQNEKKINNAILTKEKSDLIISSFNNTFRATQTSDDEIFKTQLVDQTKQIYQKASATRKNEERKLFLVMKQREEVVAQITARNDIENKLESLLFLIQQDYRKDSRNYENNIKGSNKFDMNVCVQSYNELIGNGYRSDLVNAVHSALSKKKEDIILQQIKKIINGKEKDYKQTALQYLNDIKVNNWTISSEVIDRLELLSK